MEKSDELKEFIDACKTVMLYINKQNDNHLVFDSYIYVDGKKISGDIGYVTEFLESVINLN